MLSGLVLTGTADELRSYRALKVLVAATVASASVTKKVVASSEEVSAQTTPLAKSLALTLPDGKTHIGVNAASMMRAVASLHPASGLAGSGGIEASLVDGWMQFAWNSIEVPLSALENAGASAVAMASDIVSVDLKSTLGILDRHLQKGTYMVGHVVTNADISVVCSLYKAASEQLWDPNAKGEELTNVKRWYKTVTEERFFTSALALRDSCSKVAAKSTSTVLQPGDQSLQ